MGGFLGTRQGLRQTDRFSVFVVNLAEYRAAEGDAAVSYLASHLDVDITDIEQLQRLAESADPHLVRTFIESSLDIGHIAEWAFDNHDRIEQLRELVGEAPSEPASLSETLAGIASLSELPASDVAALTEFLRTAAAPVLDEVLTDPGVLNRLYATAPDAFREVIRSDASAGDVVALAHRKAVVERFRTLLRDRDAFGEARRDAGGRREAVWQRSSKTIPGSSASGWQDNS